MARFADFQYFIYADNLGGSEKVQNYPDVVYEWSLVQLSSPPKSMKIIQFGFLIYCFYMRDERLQNTTSN